MGHRETRQINRSRARDESVYYSGIYWNDYRVIRDEINKRVSGKQNLLWYEHFQHSQKLRLFDKALIIGCGNGRVSRRLYKNGLFREAVCIDDDLELVDEARRKSEGLPLRFYHLDINSGELPEGDFDLVINHAAAHHLINIDKVFRKIASSMTETGVMVNFDYVGPHRNQYTLRQWLAAIRVNRQLPAHMRQELKYPHLPTLLRTDPTEAVHSELILPTTRRYFDIIEHKHMGGAIAYLLLTNNQNFQHASRADVEKWSKFIMDEDAAYLKRNPKASMFDYWVALPTRRQYSEAELKRFDGQEKAREDYSQKHSGFYYPLSYLQKRAIVKEERRLRRTEATEKRHSRHQKFSSSLGGDLRYATKILFREGPLMLIRKFLFSPNKRPMLQPLRYAFVAGIGIATSVIITHLLMNLFGSTFQTAITTGSIMGLMAATFIGIVLNFSRNLKDYLRPRFFSVLAAICCLAFFGLGAASTIGGTKVSMTAGQALTYDEISLLPNGYYHLHEGKYFINPEHPPLVKAIAAVAFAPLKPHTPPELTRDVLLQDYAQYAWGKAFLFESNNNTEQIILRARLGVLAVNSILLFVLYLSIAKAWSRRAGFTALLFIVTSQYFLAHASLVTVDFMPAVFSMLTLIWFTIWVQRFRSNLSTRWPAILTAAFLAGALLSKFSAILLLPALILGAVIYALLVRKDIRMRLFSFCVSTVGILLLSLTFIVGFYTLQVRNMDSQGISSQLQRSYDTERLPTVGLRMLEKTSTYGIVGRAFTEFAHGILMVNNRIYKGAGGVYFMDRFYGSEGAGPWYFVVLYFTKLQLTYLVINMLAVLGGLYIVIRAKRRKLLSKLGSYPLPMFLGLYAAIFGTIAIGSTLQIGLRHIMPTIMSIMIITGLGLDIGFNILKRRLGKRAVMIICVLVAVALSLNMLKSHPYYLSSYNLLAGGTMDGHEVAVDSNYDWGQDMKRLAKWQQDIGVSKIYADVFTNPFLPLSYYLGPNVERYNITTDQPLAPGSYLAVSATKYQTNVHRYTSGPQSYRQYDDDFVARVGTSIFVYKVPQN